MTLHLNHANLLFEYPVTPDSQRCKIELRLEISVLDELLHDGLGEIGILEVVVLNRHRYSYRTYSDALKIAQALAAFVRVAMHGLAFSSHVFSSCGHFR